MMQSCVVIEVMNERTHKPTPLVTGTVWCRCYGGSTKYDDSEAVAQAVRKLLDGPDEGCVQLSGGTLLRSDLTNGDLPPVDAETEMPIASEQYFVQLNVNRGSNMSMRTAVWEVLTAAGTTLEGLVGNRISSPEAAKDWLE